MAKATRYAPAKPGRIIPMPDRDNRPMPTSGAPLDLGKAYYRRLLDDGDIVEVESKSERPAGNRRRQNRK